MMAGRFGRDPVSAISEAEATGETAAIFADIRATMEIPLITSIWRSLYDVDGGLAAAWQAVKPLYQTGQPAVALARLVAAADLPLPIALAPGQLACAGIGGDDLPAIRGILDAYNRSNGMNMLALTALVSAPSGSAPDDPPLAPPAWPPLRPLLAQADIYPDTWSLLNEIRHLGGWGERKENEVLATLWRHLAHWPGLLALIQSGFAPLQADGTIARSAQQAHERARLEGGRLAQLRLDNAALPDEAHKMIAAYVGGPGAVARMVTLGHGLARWLKPWQATKKRF